MDNFLLSLYKEETEKQASIDMENFFVQQPIEELEAFLGIKKHAVGGPVETPLPDSLPGRVLDAKQKAIDDYSAKARLEKPPTREQAEDASHSTYSGKGKEASVRWADNMGRRLAKLAGEKTEALKNIGQHLLTGGLLGAGVGALGGAAFGEEGDKLRATGRGALVGAGIGGGMNASSAAVKHLVRRHPKLSPAEYGISRASELGGGILGGSGGALLAKKLGLDPTKGKVKSSFGVGDTGPTGVAGQGLSQGLETTASLKAKIASTALSATKGAPDHIKQAAIKLAGRQMAECLT
jgi:hypothetical protein